MLRAGQNRSGSPIRIGLDARIVKPTLSGLGRYASELVTELTSMDVPGVEWVIIKLPSMADTALASPGSRATEVVIGGELDLLENLVRAREVDALKLDLYHSLHHFLPPKIRTRRVVITVHDLMWVNHADLAYYGALGAVRGVGLSVYGKSTMQYALRRSDAVVTNSEATRQAVLEHYDFVSPENITATPLAVRPHRFPKRGGPERGGPEPQAPYFFCLGNTRPYKNVKAVMRAFATLSATEPAVRLAVAGRGDGRTLLEKMARSLGVSDRVDFLGMVEDSEIVNHFHQARGLIFPSKIEGFGLPVLEAMHAGCPVLVSDIAVFDEIVADAGIRVPAESDEDIVAGMRRLLHDTELRTRLRLKAWERAERFTWRRCAETTLGAYDALLDRMPLD